MAAAAVSLACPLRRSTRLAHAHSHPHPTHRRPVKYQRHHPEPDNEHDSSSSSSDPENELTPRALRALKRQRLALDPDGLLFSSRPRSKRRRRENAIPAQRPSARPLTPKCPQATDGRPLALSACLSADSCHSPHSTATAHAASPTAIPEPINDPANENRPPSPTFYNARALSEPSKPELSIPPPPISSHSSPSSSDPEPLTPLTPLTPSPESSPSLPGHDRQALPPQDPLSPPVSLDPLPMSDPTPNQQQSSVDSLTPPPLPPPLDPTFNTLIPFDGLHPQFDPELSVQISPPPTPPQLQALELQGQFHSFPQHQLYVPPNPVFVRDREINIWKLACQERVDCLLRRYGSDYIKALVESQAHSVSRETRSFPPPGTSPSQTKFRLYTPASYTYSLSSWGSTSATRKAFPVDDQADDADYGWPMDDADWVDADVDMEDDDEEDDDDDDDAGEGEVERQDEATLEAVEGLVITNAGPPEVVTQPTVPMDVDGTSSDGKPTTKATASSEAPASPRSAPDPSTPISHPFPTPPPLTPPTLPPLSSLHVPLLSEPPRAFMGRGTPPDRRRLIEWSGSGPFATNGIGPPLYLTPVPQRHASTDVGIISMSVDAPIHPPPPQAQPPHAHGEWTTFLYSMLEGDGVGVGVGVGTNVGGAGHTSEPTWYELGLGSVPPVAPEPVLELPPSRTATPSVEQPVDEGSNSSSTLRFALG